MVLIPFNTPLRADHPLRRGAVVMTVRRLKPTEKSTAEVKDEDFDNEPKNLLAETSALIRKDLQESGSTVTDLEQSDSLTVSFVPRPRTKPSNPES